MEYQLELKKRQGRRVAELLRWSRSLEAIIATLPSSLLLSAFPENRIKGFAGAEKMKAQAKQRRRGAKSKPKRPEGGGGPEEGGGGDEGTSGGGSRWEDERIRGAKSSFQMDLEGKRKWREKNVRETSKLEGCM
jgi:hypothetical protein